MYNRKYILEKIEEFHRHNHLYDDMEGCLCYPVYFNVRERGWFLYHQKDYWNDLTPHRVHTSVIKDVQYTDDTIVVTTMNTRFTFRLIKKKGENDEH